MVELTMSFIVQILCIIASGIGLLSGSLYLFNSIFYTGLTTYVFLFYIFINAVTVTFSGVLLSAELYLFPIFKYFTFVLTTWGKAFLYFTIGAFLLYYNYLASFISWGLGVFFVVITFTGQPIAKPLLQSPESLDLTQNTKDFYP